RRASHRRRGVRPGGAQPRRGRQPRGQQQALRLPAPVGRLARGPARRGHVTGAETTDVVVAGAGHNGLITAAYVARTGRSVTVLDARPIPGGGAASEELLLPGFLTDSCSTGHTIILTNPLMVDDE